MGKIFRGPLKGGLICALKEVEHLARRTRRVVLSSVKHPPLHTRFDRKLLGRLCRCFWTCVQKEAQRLLGRDNVLPRRATALQPHGDSSRRTGFGSGTPTRPFRGREPVQTRQALSGRQAGRWKCRSGLAPVGLRGRQAAE